MNLTILFTFLVISCFIVHNNAGRILMIYPMHSRIHSDISLALQSILAKRGHNVTSLTINPRGLKVPNFQEIYLKDFIHPWKYDYTNTTIQAILDLVDLGSWTHVHSAYQLGTDAAERVIKDRTMQKILNSKRRFDLVILVSFGQEVLLGISHRFQAPTVVLSAHGMNMFTDVLVGNPAPFAAVPNVYFAFNERMSFGLRVYNAMFGLFVKLYQGLYHFPKQNELLRKYFPNAPDVYDLMKNVSIVLSNSHESLTYPRAMAPNVIQVGGLHVGIPPPLIGDIGTYMNASRKGVIYVNMGHTQLTRTLPRNIRVALIEAFAKLNYNVLLRWDERTVEDLSLNVRISPFFPQQSVLAHPKTILFITHGGLLSVQESIAFGVPFIGIPLHSDQMVTLRRVFGFGTSIVIHGSQITEKLLLGAIIGILENKTYAKQAKKLGKLHADRVVDPLHKAVYWIEYVLRYKGAPHLRTSVDDLYLYEYLLLDILLVVIIVMVVIWWSCKITCFLCCRACERCAKIKDENADEGDNKDIVVSDAESDKNSRRNRRTAVNSSKDKKNKGNKKNR